jgi:hypothetical protein
MILKLTPLIPVFLMSFCPKKSQIRQPRVNPDKLRFLCLPDFSPLSLVILKYRQYFLILQTLKLNNRKQKKSSFYKEKSLVGLIPWSWIHCTIRSAEIQTSRIVTE